MDRETSMLSGLTILLIESEPITRDTLIAMLEREGASVQFEARRREGLAILSTLIPDCILCNIKLTDGSGYELIEQLREIETYLGIAQTPAIAIFNSERIANSQLALESGFQAAITHPLQVQEVIDTVLRLTSRTRFSAE